MKRVIVASTHKGAKQLVESLLEGADGVKDVQVRTLSDSGGIGVIYFSDGTSCTFQIHIHTKREEREIPTKWKPEYRIDRDGRVFNENGELIGYFNLLQRPPRQSLREYDESSIVISVGSKDSQLLQPGTEEPVAHMLHKFSK